MPRPPRPVDRSTTGLPSRRRALAQGGAVTAAMAAAIAGFSAWPARAHSPTGADGTLLITGKITKPNDGSVARLSMAQLRAMPQVDIVTTTPWSKTAQRFTGPRVRDLLAAVGARGTRLMASALNDYRVELPLEEVQKYDVIVAVLLDGAPMSVRDKGPLFVMYPFDRAPQLRDTIHFSRCIWQLNAIEVA